MNACSSPLDWDTLLAYWLGELESDIEAQTEAHYLGCPICSQRLAQLTVLGREVRELTRLSGVEFVISDPFARRLKADGMNVREYRVPANGSVNCTVTADDDFVVARLEAPLEGVTRVDMVYLDSDGNSELRKEDIPFAADGVLFATRIEALRSLPEITLRLRLLAVDTDTERTLGEYTFNHTPGNAET